MDETAAHEKTKEYNLVEIKDLRTLLEVSHKEKDLSFFKYASICDLPNFRLDKGYPKLKT